MNNTERCDCCVWYNGDNRDKQAFCDDKEEYVCGSSYCYRFKKDEDKLTH